ncbi:MAG: hypothetical protein CLLPBCKN_000638 [Chroococcidiopsis cubana SAG 39.79]|uniref:ABC transmembrane type-1 domain-containing protein n=1 Tax=Chroococcidiopsis cubana SAG 39.79 TaxID=388085 RepID=A0AB37UKT5_9CYAN|nr:hypothetical protein [Chroococcidiopsis cubana SAG 39.79]PSB41528.1 hypothetical protein C7B80_30375 [Cyanosarcina cf. burmensis CCALA 770]PSB60626.1 hypothetical protein C7B79_25025 [Chroococcidiopsis cubana CCALA 043]RUT11985.1 hypothetical protein DSM107010_27930 [Chroococcidiopsis cubana SAG 39.79]
MIGFILQIIAASPQIFSVRIGESVALIAAQNLQFDWQLASSLFLMSVAFREVLPLKKSLLEVNWLYNNLQRYQDRLYNMQLSEKKRYSLETRTTSKS